MKLVLFTLLILAVMFIIVGCKAKISTVDGQVTAVSDRSEITITWQKSEDAILYQVYRGTEVGKELIVPIISDISETTWVDSEVVKGVTYFYKIAGVNQDGVVGQPSLQEGSAKLLKDPPLFESDISSTSDNRMAKLFWQKDIDAVSYNVYRGLAPDKEALKPIVTGLTDTEWIDKNVENGVTYYYQMASVDSDGEVSPLSRSEAKASPFFAVSKEMEGRKAKIAFDFSPAGKIKICYTTNSCSQTNYSWNSVQLTLTTASGKVVASRFDSYPSSVTWGPAPDIVRTWKVPKQLRAGSYVLKIIVREGDWQNDVGLIEILPVK